MDPIRLDNATQIDLLADETGFFGLGAVRVEGQTLRNGTWPMFADITSPEGGALCDFQLDARDDQPDRTILRLSARRWEQPLAEWMAHEIRPIRNTRRRAQAPSPLPQTRVELELRPVERRIDNRRYIGFSYQYRYRSAEMPIYQLVDRSSWEITGSCPGNTFWMRSLFAKPLNRFERSDDRFSTSWRLPTHRNPFGFQFAPLQTELQGFTFTTHDRGTLVTWPTQVAHIRSLFDKPADADAVFHWHEHCQDLDHELITAPVEVLFSAGACDQDERINQYEAVKELVHESLHEQIGMRRERVTTFGMMEEWTRPDLERYASRGLPALAEANVQTVELANQFQNNMNVYDAPNMCCTLDWTFPDRATEAALTRLCHTAKRYRMDVMNWGNTALSTLALILDRNGLRTKLTGNDPRSAGDGQTIWDVLSQADEPFVRNPSGAIEADHYTPEFAVLNLRDPVVREYWLKRWGEAAERVGFRGIFLDSSFNLSSDKFHYCLNPVHEDRGATADEVDLLDPEADPDLSRPRILSQYHAHLSLMVQMQKLGYVYCGEDCGVFGIHRHGPSVRQVLDNLFMWTDTVLHFDAIEIEEAGADPQDVFFRGLAMRVMWLVHWVPKSECLSFCYGKVRDQRDVPGPWHKALLGIHRRFERHMFNRRVIDHGRMVVYHDNDADVRLLWACEGGNFAAADYEHVWDLLNDQMLDTDANGHFAVERHHVYLLAEPAVSERLRSDTAALVINDQTPRSPTATRQQG